MFLRFQWVLAKTETLVILTLSSADLWFLYRDMAVFRLKKSHLKKGGNTRKRFGRKSPVSSSENNKAHSRIKNKLFFFS